jgi:sulfite dehydrogenase (cytochrome) subunit B
MKRRLLFGLLLVIVLALILKYGAGANAAPLAYELPPETAAFGPGPNRETVMNNCTGCHSADYVHIQPRGPKFGEDFWRAEVTKMIKTYGAPVAESDIPKIVEYLTATH